MELEDDLRVVGNNMKQLEISEQEVMMAGIDARVLLKSKAQTLVCRICLKGIYFQKVKGLKFAVRRAIEQLIFRKFLNKIEAIVEEC